MRNRSILNSILVLTGLVAVTIAAYTFARFFLAANPPEPIFSTNYGTATPIPFSTFSSKITAVLQGRIHSFAVSPDGKNIAFATSKGIVLYDLVTYKPLQTLNDAENSFSVSWSADGKHLAAGSLLMSNTEAGRPHLVVWDTSTWKIVFEPKMGSGDTVFFGALAWSPNGKFLATSDYDRGLVVFDLETGKIISRQKDFLMSPYDISWAPNGSRIVATGDLGYGFRRWRIETDKSVRIYDNRAAAFAVQLKWSPDGRRIASVHADGTVCFWTVATNQCDGFIKAHPTSAFSLAWSPDGTQIATGGGVIRIWNAQNGKLITSFGQNDGNGPIYSELQWVSNNTLVSLETGYADQELTIVRFWDVDTGSSLREFHGASSIFGE